MSQDGYQKLAYIFEVNSLDVLADEKVIRVINDSTKPITKAEIEGILVNLSRTTIEKSLSTLLKENRIQLIQSGRYAKYYKI